MKTDKIPFSLSVDELYEILNKKYGDVKKKGDNILMLKYSNTKITINKWTDGYVVKAGLPIWLIIVIGVVCGATVVATHGLGLAPQFLLTMFAVAIVIFLADYFYNANKENLLHEFCDSLNIDAVNEKSEDNLQDHVPDFAEEAAKPITNQRVGLTGLLPSFSDMNKDATAEEIVRVAALTNTILNLTFKNPFPIDQDPVFGVVLKANNEWAKEQLTTGKYKIEPHEDLKETFEEKYSATIAKQMMEIDYWNQRMIEHAVITKTLGPKPAYQCLQAALNLSSFAGDASAVLIVNFAQLLLKCSMLKLQNPVAIGDIKQVLKQASSFLHFDEGVEYSQQ